MIILALDTSALAASAAVMKDGKIISENYLNTGLNHSETVMLLVDGALKNAGLSVDDVDILAVAAGPGSFTGIRIGVSAVKGLAFAKNKPCMPVSTLEALAYCVNAEDVIICPVMDARCMQVYTALFEKKDGDIRRITEDQPLKLEELALLLQKEDKKTVLIGDGADLGFDYLSEKGLPVSVFSEIFQYQHASGVAIAAQRMYNKGVRTVSGQDIVPIYLRLSQAERELKKRSAEK